MIPNLSMRQLQRKIRQNQPPVTSAEARKQFVRVEQGSVDFAARRKEIWGDRVFSAEEVKKMRDAEDSEE